MASSAMCTTLSALLVILAIANLTEANGHASLGLDVQTVKFEDLVVDAETGMLSSVDLVSTSTWSGMKAWYGKVPFCFGRVWVGVQPQDVKSKKKPSCPDSAGQTFGCGFSACTTVWEPKPWYKWPRPDLEGDKEKKGEHHAHAPAPGPHHHHHHHDDDDHHHDDDEHKGRDPHDHPLPHLWTSRGPAPAPGHGGHGMAKPPMPSCSSSWKVKGFEVTLHQFQGRAEDQHPSLGYWGRERPCKWVPSSTGARILVCVKCAGASKRPPVLRTQEMTMSDHGDEPVWSLPAAAIAVHGAQVDPDFIPAVMAGQSKV